MPSAGFFAQINDMLQRATGRRFMKPPQVVAPRVEKQLNGVEPDAAELMQRVADRTMTVPLQQYTTWSAMRHVVRRDIPGAFVECGTWRGGHGMLAALTLLQNGDDSRDIYLFDTFEGMSDPTTADVLLRDGTSATTLLDQQRDGATDARGNVWCVAGLEDVRAGMDSTGYPTERVHLVPGFVEDTIPDAAPEQIAVLRLDTDWYESTLHELAHLWERVVPQGIVIIDDYDIWAGSRRAVDEFLDTLDHPPMLFRPGEGRAFVKA